MAAVSRSDQLPNSTASLMSSQLSLFSRWHLRNRSESIWWRNNNYKPQVGQLTQLNMELGFNLNVDFKPNSSYLPDRLYCVSGGSAHYIQAINQATEEVLIYSPGYPEMPWITDRWYLVDYYDLKPVTIWKFSQAEYRARYPEKPCPYPILWGKYVEAYNNRVPPHSEQ